MLYTVTTGIKGGAHIKTARIQGMKHDDQCHMKAQRATTHENL